MGARIPDELRGWLGSKGGNGAWQRVINEIPACRTYVEGFVGGGAVFGAMRAAERSWIVDADPGVIAAWTSTLAGRRDVTAVAMPFLEALDRSSLGDVVSDPDTVVYLDPPYLGETRGSSSYRVDMRGATAHLELLRWAIEARCRVLISGYWSSLYGEMLQAWRSIHFQVGSHGGAREEWLWMNFSRPNTLQDARFVGDTFRDRERVKRRARSLLAQLEAMGAAEKQHCWEYLLASMGEGIRNLEAMTDPDARTGNQPGPDRSGRLTCGPLEQPVSLGGC